MNKILTSLISIGFAMTLSPTGTEAAPDPENVLVLEVESGEIVIEMLPEVAPNHVARIRELTREGFYDGIVFHRVMEGFMAQTGDPTGTGTGGSGQNIAAEFSREPFLRGTLGMARAQSPNSADSQFFITFDATPNLDGQYTVWGRVIGGMKHVDRIKKAPAGSRGGTVDNPDKIVRMRVKADIEE